MSEKHQRKITVYDGDSGPSVKVEGGKSLLLGGCTIADDLANLLVEMGATDERQSPFGTSGFEFGDAGWATCEGERVRIIYADPKDKYASWRAVSVNGTDTWASGSDLSDIVMDKDAGAWEWGTRNGVGRIFVYPSEDAARAAILGLSTAGCAVVRRRVGAWEEED